MSLSHITIIGLGLIGGSLAKALKHAKPSLKITAYARSQETINKAKASGAIDDGSTNLAQAVKDSDAIIVCTPLSTYAFILKEALPHLKANTIISDAGSAKQVVIDTWHPLLSKEQQAYLVPAHPIAGAETSGFEAASVTLYQGKRLITTPTSETSEQANQAIHTLWSLAGAVPESLTATRHDAIYAAVSHAPQWLAFAYGKLLKSLPVSIQEAIESSAGVSFKRFRRIGNSPTVMWDDIFAANQSALRHTLDKVQDALNTAAHHLEINTEGFAKAHASLNILEHSTLFGTIPNQALIYLHVMPVMLARALHSVAEPHLSYAGTGFADFTCKQQIPLPAKDIEGLKTEILKALQTVINALKQP